jgi:ketosteroid isomerase-like protein
MEPEKMSQVSMSQEAEQKSVEAAFERYFTAFKAKDTAYLVSMLAPDFEWKTLDGETLSATEAAALLESYVQSFEFIETARCEISDLSVQAGEATFTITEYISGTLKDEQGNSQRISTVETFLDVMAKGPQGWQFKRAETLSSDAPPT